MQELIPVTTNEADEQIVSGRVLHEFLEIGTEYTKWFERMCGYGFQEGIDHSSVLTDGDGFGKAATRTDHALKLDMAKELCMLARSDKGKQARQYFIAVEKAWNAPELVMARGLKVAQNLLLESQERLKVLEVQVQADRPKVIFADAVSVSKTSILVGEMAKILKQNGVDMGQNRLFEWLRSNGYLISRKGTDYNMPTQYSMERGLFEIKKTSVTHSDGHTTINKTPKVTGKGQIYFVNKFKLRLPEAATLIGG